MPVKPKKSVTPSTVASSPKRLNGFAVAGISVGAVILTLGLIGGGVAIGANLPHGGGMPGVSQQNGPDNGPGHPNGPRPDGGPNHDGPRLDRGPKQDGPKHDGPRQDGPPAGELNDELGNSTSEPTDESTD